MTCSCQKLQGVIYRTKDGSFYLLNLACTEHGGVKGTSIGYVICDEATHTQLGTCALMRSLHPYNAYCQNWKPAQQEPKA